MTWVKICGITNLEDALTAVDAGADALGFVFHEKSPRKVRPDTAREIVARLPGNVEKVGVFVYPSVSAVSDQADLNAPVRVFLEQVWRLVRAIRFNAVQMVSADWPPESSSIGVDLGPEVKSYFTVPAKGMVENVRWIENSVPADVLKRFAVILDSGGPQQPGGTGKPFDWAKAAPLVHSMSRSVNVVIAGGLTPSNVTEAIRTLHPWGVDVSSGVEARPGKKDPEKVRAFVTAVREADKVH
jgi:phosphoribosylanthranilate isomerase